MMSRAARCRTACLTTLLLLVATNVTHAQRVRIAGTTWIQSIDLRPLRDDSVSIADAPGDGIYRTTSSGDVVRCVDGASFCHFFSSGARATTTPLMQDLSLAAWGVGEGVSFHAQGRFRASLGGNERLWPRMSDRFDLIDAYLELDRSRMRARLGRLWSMNSLGAYNFDGASLVLRKWGASIEGYGGRALIQGLNEGYTSGEIGQVDDLPPEDDGYLVGGRLRVRPNAVTAISVVYQRVVRADRSDLFSERTGADVSTMLFGASLDGSVVYDIATNTINEGRIRAAHRLFGSFTASVEARRHRPFFDLWTIWGAFAPVGFDEARGNVTWRAAADRLQFDAHGAYRTYADANTGLASLPLRSNGWRAGASATFLASQRLSASASYDVDLGFGASRSDGSAGFRWTRSEGTFLGVNGSAFQTIYEFEVGTGRVFGGAFEAGTRLTNDLRIAADAGVYHHQLSNGARGTDWSQRRASVRLEWAIGPDPGMTSGRGGVR